LIVVFAVRPYAIFFVPALYLTSDPDVAGCYARNGGAIYEVEVAGNHQLTIALNRKWKDQSVDARMAVREAFKVAGVPFHVDPDDDARAMIDLLASRGGKRSRNRLLQEQGIWLLYGHLDPSEANGLCDRGVQYAVISGSTVVAQRIWPGPVP
jgi:hypothetical protein